MDDEQARNTRLLLLDGSDALRRRPDARLVIESVEMRQPLPGLGECPVSTDWELSPE
jgi:hypothetical protein